ncbi:MAG: universal stress protein [Methanomassiliicoccales archaeon]
MSRILLPTDSSVPALAATIKAVDLAKSSGAELIILSVIEQSASMGGEIEAENAALKRCPGIDGVVFARELAKKRGVTAIEVEREGAVTGEILRTAAEKDVGIIVMGSSKPKGLSGLYLGDVAASVNKGAKCVVITVNPTPEEGKIALEMARTMALRENPKTVASITKTRQFRIGLYLFGAYAVFYGIFVLLGTYGRGLMKTHMLGMNLGIVLGFLIIIVAIVMAVWFNLYATRAETAKAKKEAK